MKTIENATSTAAAELLDHMGVVEADCIFNFVTIRESTDKNGNLWFHARGYNNGDDSKYNDINLYEVKPSGVIKSYEPKDDSYWNTDWVCDPIEFLDDSKIRNRYFEKPEICARFNKESGELTSRNFKPLYGGPINVRKDLWVQSEDNPFTCTIAGAIEQYCD